MKHIQTFIAILLVFVLTSCGESADDKKKKLEQDLALEKTNKILSDSTVDYSEIAYSLPNSKYVYNVKITGIETKISKGAFSKKADDYAVPEKVDGYFLTIKFAMTNPYDKEMIAPVSRYYYITSANGEWFTSSTTNHRQCHCSINNSTEVSTLKGQRLDELPYERCGSTFDYCFKFQPKETKEFKIKFTDPIYGDVRKIAFNGFGLECDNPSYTRKQDKALIIDVDKKKVIGEKNF